MPNFDGGHYFYTGLFPVRLAPQKRKDGSYTVPSHLLREALASLPNFSEAAGQRRVSPFARCHATHFVRLAVIDDPAFNGRISGDAIFSAGSDPLVPQPVDLLSRPWLMLTVDFDAPDGSAESRDRWAAGLWELMSAELIAVFEYCCEFTIREKIKATYSEDLKPVDSGQAFAAYLARGQIDTTMSFNDYWIDPPNLPSLTVGTIKAIALIPPVLFALAAIWLRWKPFHWPTHWLWPWQWHWDWGGILLVIGAALLGLALGVWALIRLISRRGARAFPTAPNSDLKSVLKGLYLQQRLVEFAIVNQGAEPGDLHRAVGEFLAKVRPDDLEAPTQARGVLKS